MQAQQTLDLGVFGRCVHGDSTRFTPCQHRLSCLWIACAHIDDLLLKIFGRANRDAATMYERAVDATLLSIACLVLRGESDINALLLILGQKTPLCEFSRRAMVDDRPDQLVKVGVCHITTLRCRAQTEAQGCESAFCNQTVCWCREMVTFIEDEQAEVP